MRKMLYILNIANRVNNFSYTAMKAAQKLGYDFHIAGNWSYANDQERIDDEKKYGIHIYQIDFVRTPYHPGNIKAYQQIKQIIDSERFDVIHCNTPIGGVVGRLAGKSCGVTPIIYQAHGFHFYKGAPLLNWMVYYPIELFLAHYTDALITINQEDYERGMKFPLRNRGKVYYVPGVGIDTTQYKHRNFSKEKKRGELTISNDEVLIVSVGDLIERKNYKVAIEAIAKAKNIKIRYVICGEGPQREELKEYAKKLGILEQVIFLGFRNDIKEILWASDIFLFTTYQEGLPRALSEAMASGLPCVASDVRGNKDLIENGKSGYLVAPNDSQGFANVINDLIRNPELKKNVGIEANNRIRCFDSDNVENALQDIYSKVGGGGVNIAEFYPEWIKKRLELGIPVEAIVIITVGDLNKNKNIGVVIEAVKRVPKVHYLICGEGPLKDQLQNQAKSIEERVYFLGYRNDIKELLAASDIFVISSLREGLSRSLMEAMATGLPCVASKIRGNTELLQDGRGGFLCEPDKVASFSKAIDRLAGNLGLRDRMREENLYRIHAFDNDASEQGLLTVYQAIVNMGNS